MSGLPREVLKWLQSLDLSWKVKCPKWDLSNGYILAEIFSWYYPGHIAMHNYSTGNSFASKDLNWQVLKNFIRKERLDIAPELVESTIHCKEGAACLLVERVYQILTNRQIRKPVAEYLTDFTDSGYQQRLPMHARTTVSQALKNNLSITELIAQQNHITNKEKAQNIINIHVDRRRMERMNDPRRFDIQPSLGEKARRSVPPLTPSDNTDSRLNNVESRDKSRNQFNEINENIDRDLISTSPSKVQFRTVNQMDNVEMVK